MKSPVEENLPEQNSERELGQEDNPASQQPAGRGDLMPQSNGEFPDWVEYRNPPVNLEESVSYCTQLTRREARNFYFAFLLLPNIKRRAISAVYTFSRRVDDAVDDLVENKKPGQSHEELVELGYQGLAYMESLLGAQAPKTDPLTLALADANKRYKIPLKPYQELIEGMKMDLEGYQYKTFEDTYRYCYHAASTVGLISIEIFGYRDKDKLDAQEGSDRSHIFEPAISLGIAMQLTNIIRDIKEDLGRGRIYLPRDEMDQFGVTVEDLKNNRMHDGVRDLVKLQVERARKYFEDANPLFPLVDRNARYCPILLKRIYSGLLDQLEARDYDIFGEKLSLKKSKKLWMVFSQWVKGLVGG